MVGRRHAIRSIEHNAHVGDCKITGQKSHDAWLRCSQTSNFSAGFTHIWSLLQFFFLFHFLLFGDALLGALQNIALCAKMSRKARKIAFQNVRPLNLWGPSSTEKSEHSWIPPVCFQALSIHCSYFARASGGEVLWWARLSVCVSVCASVSLPVCPTGSPESHARSSPIFPCLLPMAMARSSSGRVTKSQGKGAAFGVFHGIHNAL